jgi:hypothetical protein
VTLSAQLAGVQSELASLKNQMTESIAAKAKYQARVYATPKVELEYREMAAGQMNLKAKFDDLMRKKMESEVAHGLRGNASRSLIRRGFRKGRPGPTGRSIDSPAREAGGGDRVSGPGGDSADHLFG